MRGKKSLKIEKMKHFGVCVQVAKKRFLEEGVWGSAEFL